MNRGRRRGGGSSSFANLRDSVRRRLFDPFIVPVPPDPRAVVGRLIPLSFTEPHIPSVLSQLDPSSSHRKPEKGSEKDLQLQLFALKAVVDYALENSLEKRKLSSKVESSNSARLTAPSASSVHSSIAHLLMKTDEIAFWDSNILSLFPKHPEWYPSELTDKLKRKSSTVVGSTKHTRYDDSSKMVDGDRPNELMPGQAMLDATDMNEDDDGGNVLKEGADEPVEGEKEEDKDSEDGRWNGEPVEEEEEEGDDYCETYFDNGEGDIDDFNVQMYEMSEDLDGSPYYE
ncbi:unnamed protein product [Hydatigera taeniaeformis]|uniref:Uncharacterized protein n=1 Tax=Hydatigena taeniaeformis TaxID=6205 RepID=A0A0R3X563_HYDTA|nr:unnamed protein product [Hydatigera taeniaeformis]